MEGAKSLDQVLENIEQFSNIAKFLNKKANSSQVETPGIQKQVTAEFKNDGN